MKKLMSKWAGLDPGTGMLPRELNWQPDSEKAAEEIGVWLAEVAPTVPELLPLEDRELVCDLDRDLEARKLDDFGVFNGWGFYLVTDAASAPPRAIFVRCPSCGKVALSGWERCGQCGWHGGWRRKQR